MTVHSTPLSSRLAGVLLGLLGLALCAAFATYLLVRHVAWPRVDAWRPWLVAQVERQLGVPVSVEALHPDWEGLHPSLRIDGLRIDGPDGAPRLAVGSAYARVSWRSLALGRVRFAALRLDAPDLVVERLAPGRIAVAGFELSGDGPADGRGLDWLLSQGELATTSATVRLVDRTGEVPPLTVDGMAFSLRSTGRRHQAAASAARPGDAAEALAVVADLYRAPLARPSDWRRWTGEAHVSGQGVDLARVAALARAFGATLPGPVDAAEGRLDALGWLRFDGGALLDATVKARAGRAATQLPEGRLAFQALAAEARGVRQRDGGLVVRVTGLSAVDAEGFALAADGDAELGLDGAGTLRSAWLRLEAFDAGAALQAALRLPLPPAARERLAGVGVAGQVRDLTLRWTRADAPAPEVRPADRSAEAARARGAGSRFELLASFERLGLQLGERPDGRRLPAFGNLSGSVRATDREGTLSLSGRQATLVLPGWLDDPAIPFERLSGDATWSRDPSSGALQVDVPKIEFANADGRGTLSAQWRSGGLGPGILELAGRLEQAELRRVPRYLPSRLPPKVREWVERSVLAGTVEDLRVEVRGDLWHFPFRDPAEGRFRLAGRLKDATLAFAPDWPRIEQIRGEAAFEGAGFEIRAQSAVSGRVRLADVVARLPEYHDALLGVEGRAAGGASDMLAFVEASPLADTVSTFTRDLRVGGDARLGMKLEVPLYEPHATRVAGTVDFPGNDVALDSTLPPFGGVTGRLEFTERGIVLPELRGTFLGGPIRVEARPAGEGRMRVDAIGSIDAAGIRTLVDNPLTRRLAGRTGYRASVDVDRRSSTLRIESDLAGLSSTLPAPFEKAAGEPWPLRVVSRPLTPPGPSARPPGDRLDIRLRDDIAFAVERERDPATERLVTRRAGFALDGEPVLRESGLSVLVRTRGIDLDAWRAVIDDGELERLERTAQGAVAGMSLVPDLVSVVADDVRVAGRDLHEVVVGASRTEGRWRANIASREIEGQFEWRDARPGERIGTLTARFARLVLPRSREVEVESVLSAPPSRLPALDVVVDDLVLGALPMGRMTLSATNGGTPAQPVWRLDRLVVANPAARLEARGAWSFVGAPGSRAAAATAAAGAAPGAAAPGGTVPGGTVPGGTVPGGAAPSPADSRSTRLDFELQVRDAGQLLDRMGLRGTVAGGGGTLAGNVRWRGSPIGIDYPTLDGELSLALGSGRFLKVDPGVAKLISVLNMQSLPKRLAGDFRDLFGEGFAFDAIDGRVRIDDGIARTGDLRMRGLQAQVTIRGEADLQHETQRLNVEVVPEFNAGLASIAVGAMVNPLLGLGSLAAQYVLRKPLQEVLAYDVDVTGSWSDPTVSERNRRVLQRIAPVPAQ